MEQDTFKRADQLFGDSPEPIDLRPESPQVTFMGNTYDLASMGALASGILMLFMCGTCNMGFYCLPFLPLVLGAIGLLAARDSVDEQRTRTWSWIGIGIGAAVLLLLGLAVIAYIGFIVFAVMVEGQ